VKLSRNVSDDAYVAALNVDEPGPLADLIASTIQIDNAARQQILEEFDPLTRLQKVHIMLAKELDLLDMESKIQGDVQKEIDRGQREYYLREQMKAIQHELGDEDPLTRDVREFREKIAAAGMPEAVRARADEELDRMAAMPSISPEASVLRGYIEWLVALPWSTATEDRLDIRAAAVTLDHNHYGLDKVKERVLEFLAVRKLAGEKQKSPILCFVGPPGVGKTSLGRSIAEAMGRKFTRISLGGVRDEAEIRGHRRTYIGALPGRVLQTMKTVGVCNPVFIMDEIDKLGMDYRGDPAAALLEVLDPEQNNSFSDHYLEVPFDLSRVLFILTANVLDPVPSALRDRMEVIELPGYTEDEKFHIARQFLVTKQLEQHGLDEAELSFSDRAIQEIIRSYTHEAGVRNLEREIGAICRKVARSVAEAGEEDGAAPAKPRRRKPKPNRYPITEKTLEKYLGPTRFSYGLAEKSDEVGVATGVSWSAAGGDTMGIEVTLMDGSGKLTLTGQLGEVMRESAQAGISYARGWARQLGIDPARFEKLDIHIHVPAGAIPKDGPSAGITMATALISALTQRPVRREVAMTGEITLRGKVLPIGGLKEKVLAAHRAGITTFILPKENEKDLTDIPANIRKQLRFVPVEQMSEVIGTALRQE
ncbi:MAG: endopeptidase La, partial [Candidatus Chloroheliales bacterium]